jgi:hypothetical protein
MSSTSNNLNSGQQSLSKHVTKKVWIAGSDMNNAQDAISTQHTPTYAHHDLHLNMQSLQGQSAALAIVDCCLGNSVGHCRCW